MLLQLPLILTLGMGFCVAELAWVGGPTHPTGVVVDCDFPMDRHQRNALGRDGLGLCVFTSLGMAADWCDLEPLVDFRDWMKSKPGGGYPQKVTAMIRELCTARNCAEPAYLQLQGGELDLLATAVRQGHMACVTYSRSPTGRYGGQSIAHMVNCVAARVGPHRLWAILDCNYPGGIEWMTEEQFRFSYTSIGGGWAIILLREGPPPVPKSASNN